MSTDSQRGGPGIRRRPEDLQEGDVVHVDDFVAEYGVVTRVDPVWIHYVRSGLEARAAAVPAYKVVDVDEILGADSADATHLLDGSENEVIVMQLSEDHSVHSEADRFDVGPQEIGQYLAWVVDRHDREWFRETMPPAARAALDAYREENGGECR